MWFGPRGRRTSASGDGDADANGDAVEMQWRYNGDTVEYTLMQVDIRETVEMRREEMG